LTEVGVRRELDSTGGKGFDVRQMFIERWRHVALDVERPFEHSRQLYVDPESPCSGLLGIAICGQLIQFSQALRRDQVSINKAASTARPSLLSTV
jgi:hypothetical protein